MPLTSAGTYARAFKAETNLPQAAGNYENKLATKFAKGMVGVFTLGIGYGIFRLIEHYCNVRPKVAEFCANAEGIHANLMAASALQKKTVECNLKSGGQLRLEEISVGPNGESVVRISDDNHTDEVPGTFKEICVKLEQEFETAPGLYALSESYKTLAAFSEMNAFKIAPIINGPEPQFYGENLYVRSMYNIHRQLSQAAAEGKTTVRMIVCEEAGEQYPLEFIEFPDPVTEQIKVILTNEATQEDITIEGNFVQFSEEFERIFTALDSTNETFKPLEERIIDVARSAIATGVRPADDASSIMSTIPLLREEDSSRLDPG
ncbi:hypothetical protein LFP87_000684 [Salmonella enterica]|nr:hypothetical protein [Salmonella enterica]